MRSSATLIKTISALSNRYGFRRGVEGPFIKRRPTACEIATACNGDKKDPLRDLITVKPDGTLKVLIHG